MSMATQERHVDSLASPETRHRVEVINLGLSRTGTMSMYQAMKTLGYTSYHMSEACLMTAKGHLTMWNEAIAAKYNSSALTKYTAADFDKLLEGYDALTDIPCILFLPELLEAYPQARLVLTVHPRGTEAWLRSMDNSYFRISNWTIWPWLMRRDSDFCMPYMTLIRRVVEIWTNTAWSTAKDFSVVKSRLDVFYETHNNEMRKLARRSGRELLEFDPTKGWEPLCKFLGKEIPPGPYPHANEGNYVVNIHKYIVILRLRALFGASVAKIVAGTVVAAIAWWWVSK